MQKLLLSVAVLALLGVVSFTTTRAFFTSTAESKGNTFTSGTLDLTLNLDVVAGGFKNSFAANETPGYGNLAPGGDTANLSTRLRNDGTTDSAAIGLAVNHTTNESSIASQMRITELTWKGRNLLVGGAGAMIPEYEAPTSCDIEVNFGNNDQATITLAIANATQGDVICVGDGNYNSTWETSNPITVDKAVTIASVNGPDNTSSIGFNITTDNVTIRGFSVVTSQPVGIQVTDADGVTIEHNTFNDFGSITGAVNTQAVYLVNGSSNAVVRYNKFDGVRSGTVSVKAIYVGHTAGTPGASNIEISNNIIENVESANKGGYGILVNAAGSTSNLVIKNNTLSNINGGWMHAIGLEGDTPNAVVTQNTFNGLTAVGADKTAVFFESNPSASSVIINENNFETGVLGVALHPDNQAGVYTIDATNNWWGDFDPSDQVYEVNSNINTSNLAGGPVVGFVNGTDNNSNGLADLRDLELSPITNAIPGLDAGEIGQLDFFVQLDGPTTGNTFQNKNLISDFTYTLGQVLN